MSVASDRLREFHEAFDVSAPSKVGNGRPGADELAERRRTMHDEEHVELCEALREVTNARPHQLMAVAEELADVIIVAYGTADLLGIDLDVAFALKMDGNMAKLPMCRDCERGWIGGGFNTPREACYTCGGKGYLPPIKRDDGKVMKPPQWQKPSMREAIK